jgi:nickel/cobalt exporter
MARLVTVILIPLLLLTITPLVRGQNPFISKDSPQKVSAATGPPPPFLARIAAWQQHLNQKMARLTREARETGSLRPLLSLIMIAFLYGVLHAVGPGHGKVVATSYLISRGKKLGEGILLGNLIAFFHGLSAVLLVVAVQFVLKRGVAGPLESVTRTTQLISYSLIVLLGAGLLTRSLLSWSRQARNDGSNPERGLKERKGGPLAMALAVGMIPCPGVVLVMLFCLSLNLVGLGLLLAFFLILGMAVTISAAGLAGLAGKNLALEALERRRRLTETIEWGIEATASILVMAFGLLFLAATL